MSQCLEKFLTAMKIIFFNRKSMSRVTDYNIMGLGLNRFIFRIFSDPISDSISVPMNF